jgi:hypothetical protein
VRGVLNFRARQENEASRDEKQKEKAQREQSKEKEETSRVETEEEAWKVETQPTNSNPHWLPMKARNVRWKRRAKCP